MHQPTQDAKKCPRCGCTLTLVAVFNFFAEECEKCPRGPIPFKVAASRKGARGTLRSLVDTYGLGIKLRIISVDSSAALPSWPGAVLRPTREGHLGIDCDIIENPPPEFMNRADTVSWGNADEGNLMEIIE